MVGGGRGMDQVEVVTRRLVGGECVFMLCGV